MMNVRIRESRPRSLRRALVALLAAAAFAAISAAGASAAAQQWYVGGKLVQSPTQVSGANSGVFNFGWTLGGVTVNARCSSATTGGVIANTESGASLTSGSLSLKECVVTSPGPQCQVGTGGKSPVNGQLIFNPLRSSGPLEGGIKYVPESGETLLIMTLSGALCPEGLKGQKVFNGSMRAVPTPGMPGSFEFSSTSGSNLTFGGQAGFIKGRFSLQSSSGEVVTLAP